MKISINAGAPVNGLKMLNSSTIEYSLYSIDVKVVLLVIVYFFKKCLNFNRH